jgi:curved DNA-binding protein
MDYYSILGVPKNASKEDIRKAYKKQSMKHHPDRGGSEEEFKKVNEAYQNLSDPQKRQMYDQFGTADPQQAGQQNRWRDFDFNNGNFQFSGSSQEFEDLFGSMFGGSPFGRRPPPRNKSVQLRVSLTLKEILEGKNIQGSVSLAQGREKFIDINIPPGVENGDQIKYQGLGDDSIHGLPPGDLIVQINEIRDPNFIRQGNEVKTTASVNVFDAMLGTSVIVDNFDGHKISIRVPEGTQPNTILSCSNKGLPSRRNPNRGNLYVEIKIQIPKNLTDEQKRMLDEIRTKA